MNPYLTITPKYSDQMPFPDSYLFEIQNVPTDYDALSTKLKRLGYQWNKSENLWWKHRYAERFGMKKRQEEIAKLKLIMPELQVMRRANNKTGEEPERGGL